MKPSTANLSLEELEQDHWGKASAQDTGLVKRCHRLRRVPVGRLTSADLRLLLGQNIGSSILVPIALAMLRDNPMLESEFYPGDLLVSLLQLGPEFWHQHKQQRKVVVSLAAVVLENEAEWIGRVGKTGVRSVRRAWHSLAVGLENLQPPPPRAQ